MRHGEPFQCRGVLAEADRGSAELSALAAEDYAAAGAGFGGLWIIAGCVSQQKLRTYSTSRAGRGARNSALVLWTVVDQG
jgi:hypothetical protein